MAKSLDISSPRASCLSQAKRQSLYHLTGLASPALHLDHLCQDTCHVSVLRCEDVLNCVLLEEGVESFLFVAKPMPNQGPSGGVS